MVSETNRTTAPFTPEQVESLNGYQKSRVMHPFTCPQHGDEDVVTEVKLFATGTSRGWVCPALGCDYTQNWAHDFMANGLWRSMADFR